MKNNSAGTVKIQRPNGTEVWNIINGRFSIDKPTSMYRLNFWIESDDEHIVALEDTGCNPISFELTIPLKSLPSFDDVWVFNFPNDFIGVHNDQGYFDNFYYYEHDSLRNMELRIVRIRENIYDIQVNGDRHDPIDPSSGYAKNSIHTELPLNSEFNGLWDE